jgi:putative transcriptional regulator
MIESNTPYQGQLIAANPNNPKDGLYGSVILITNHAEHGSIGIQINARLNDLTLGNVMEGLGIQNVNEDSMYRGGNMETGKVHVIHSPDWTGLNTLRLTAEISITNDVSILAAISQGEGPEYYRSCVGYWMWEPGTLDAQLSAKSGSEVPHRWEMAPANIDTVFKSEGMEQWYNTLEISAKEQVNQWF